MGAILKIDDDTGHFTPFTTISAAKAKELWIENAQGVRELTYGTRAVRGSFPPHDHGQEGGEVWPEVIAVSFARTNGRASVGIPYVEASVEQTIQDIITGATEVRSGMLGYKLVATIPVLLRGGWRAVEVRLTMQCPNEDDEAPYLLTLSGLELAQSLIPVNTEGLPLAQAEISLNNPYSAAPVGSGYYFSNTTEFDSDEINKLGDFRFDRMVELRIWQTGLTYDTFGASLVSASLYPTEIASIARHPLPRDKSQAIVTQADLTNGPVTPELTNRIRKQQNQQIIGMLGRAPGLGADGRTIDRRTSFQQDIYYPHQHQGVLVPDGEGGFFSDGADLRLSTYGVYMANTSDNADPIRGILLHDFDDLANWLYIKRRISVSAGCAALDLVFCLGIAGTGVERVVCKLFCDVRHVGTGESIVSYLSSHALRSDTTADDLYSIEVDPVNHPAYQRNEAREKLGHLGHWSLFACLPEGDLPDHYDGPETGVDLGRTAAPYRISNPVRIHLTHPGIRPNETAHPTGDYTLHLRWAVYLPDTNGDPLDFSNGHDLRWWHLRPAPEHELGL